VTQDVSDAVKTILERWGLPTLYCLILMVVIRYDLIIPLVEQHGAFLRSISDSQKEIAEAVKDQTRLLYALQPQLKAKE